MSRRIVITGAGRGFCAGLDLQDQASGKGLGGGSGIGATTQKFNLRDAPPTVLHNVDTPTLCALNGGAAGYGMDLALGCDIRICAKNAKFALPAAKLGLGYSYDGTKKLIDAVGPANAAEIFYTAGTYGAEDALRHALTAEEERAYTAGREAAAVPPAEIFDACGAASEELEHLEDLLAGDLGPDVALIDHGTGLYRPTSRFATLAWHLSSRGGQIGASVRSNTDFKA